MRSPAICRRVRPHEDEHQAARPGSAIDLLSPTHPGNCGFNGEGCTLIETTLVNVAPGNAGSSTDISLIPPHSFSVTSGFGSVPVSSLLHSDREIVNDGCI